jgi:hypothetical protein
LDSFQGKQISSDKTRVGPETKDEEILNVVLADGRIAAISPLASNVRWLDKSALGAKEKKAEGLTE